MAEPTIRTIKHLHDHLHIAMQLEHATIPTYLFALYSIHPGTNVDATHVLRTVVVEEMLHLTLAANILNAVGGEPCLTTKDFVPCYPARLPDGETDFTVDLQRFSKDAIETFLKIERPSTSPEGVMPLVRRPRAAQSLVSSAVEDPDLDYYSIGEFYKAIADGLHYLHKTLGHEALFGHPNGKQVSSEYFYSGGGEVIEVTGLEEADDAISLITDQGEGFGGAIYDTEHELAHYYRFQQLKLGRYYQAGDKPGEPSGPALTVDWDATYPIEKNPRLSHYHDPELRGAAVAFNGSYADFLAMLDRAYNGEPHLLLEAVPQMFRLREKMIQLIRNPLPGKQGVNAAPTFEIFAECHDER